MQTFTQAVTTAAISGPAIATTAASAVTSPVWLPWLQQASQVAGLALPILGCLLAALQLGLKIYDRMIARRPDG